MSDKPRPKLILRSHYDSELLIDGQSIAIEVKRLDNKLFDAYVREFQQHEAPRGGTVTADPSSSVPGILAEVADDAAADARRAWIRTNLSAYVRILPGQLQFNGSDVTDGGQLLEIFGGRGDVVPQALGLIWGENHVPEAKKKLFRLHLDSELGSLADLPAPGNAPAPTAASAEPRDSAAPAPATDDPAESSSGMTAPTLEEVGAASA